MIAAGKGVLIVGIGNELFGDEGLGVHVARSLLASRARLPPQFQILEAGTALFDVMAEMSRYGRLILVDAIRTGREPGFLYRVELEDELEEKLAVPPLSLHQTDLFGTLAAAKLLGLLPKRLTLLGAEPERIEFTTELSPTLQHAAARIVSALLAEASGGAAIVPTSQPR